MWFGKKNLNEHLNFVGHILSLFLCKPVECFSVPAMIFLFSILPYSLTAYTRPHLFFLLLSFSCRLLLARSPEKEWEKGEGKKERKKKKRTASKLDLGGLSRFRGSFSPSLSLFYLSSLPPPPPLLLLPGYFIFIYLVPRGGNFLDCDDAGRKEIDRWNKRHGVERKEKKLLFFLSFSFTSSISEKIFTRAFGRWGWWLWFLENPKRVVCGGKRGGVFHLLSRLWLVRFTKGLMLLAQLASKMADVLWRQQKKKKMGKG